MIENCLRLTVNLGVNFMTRPVIGIPIGDPAGIGPEIVLKALQNQMLYRLCKPLVVGNLEIIKRIDAIIHSGLDFNAVQDPGEGQYQAGVIDLISLEDINADQLRFGEVQAEAGRAAYQFIVKAAELANTGAVAAMATTPINKAAIKAAGINFIGHTEMLASLTNTEDPLTMFQVRNMRVFFLTRHVSLRKACDLVAKDRLVDYMGRCLNALHHLGIENGLLAVAGLNPHNGEHGLFGDEEVREVEPAIRTAREMGLNVTGPIPADSVFAQALKGKYDAVLSLYHDQGHIATKTVDFERTISLTIGMPFLRTSVDHGTAFDIAGKGIAGSVSMEEAIRLAAEYSRQIKGKV
jgi:4-hydroxythreonine-4-phosphate dehydrogenase